MRKNIIQAGMLKTIATFVALNISVALAAQQNLNYNPEPLSERLQKINTDTGRNIAYNKALLQNLSASTASGTSDKPEELLQQSLAGTGFTFRRLGTNDFMIVRNNTQTGSGRITGTIVDEVGNPVTGAEVKAAGKTTTTDNNGEFALEVPAGVHTLTVHASGYTALRVENLTVKNRETNTVSFALNPASMKETSIKEVVVTAIRKADTQSGLLAQQKKAAQMSDGISAEQISKTPDSDVGGTLKRVTGVTTVDNKYVVVRSMGERWNTAAMDGVNLPSTEAYNNNFSFDIIPTAMVESVVVSKTATPDMNANFAGGFVEVKTKDIPNQDFLTVSMGTSFNTVSTFKEFLTRQRGEYDYFGFDDGTRDFPKGLEPMDWNNPLFFEQSKQFKDNFSTFRTTADPNSNMQIAFGKSFAMKNSNKWGFAGAVTLRNEQNKLDIDHTARGNWLNTGVYNDKWEEEGTEPVTFYNFRNKGASYNYNSTVAGMLNFGLQLGKSRISFRNTYTHIYDNTLTMVTGWNEYTGGSGLASMAESSYNYFYNGIIPDNDPAQIRFLDRPYTDNASYPIFQTLLQNKLEGNHKIGKFDLTWFGARTSVSSDTKDYTLHKKFHEFIGKEILGYYQIYNPSENFARGFIESRETDYNYGTSLKWSFDFGKIRNDVKVGYDGAFKHNTNEQMKFFLRVDENRDVPNNEKNRMNMYGSLAFWFDGSHYQAGGIGWQTKPTYKDTKFEAEVEQHTPYLMFDNRFGTKFRLVWGARAEQFRYKLISQQMDEADARNINRTPVEDKLWQFMPSANFTYSPTNKINLRTAYYRSVMRPQFNERTGLPYADPVASALIYNTALTSSVANNYDFKFEWFPGLGEILSAGVYYKKIDRPIERVGTKSSEGTLFLYNMNSHNAKLLGFEVEFSKSLKFLWRESFLENFFINGNFVYNKTKVVAFSDIYKTKDGDMLYETDRPLYGQTPWAYNVGFSYNGERLGINLLYNAKGDQYITVGYDYFDEEIQRPYAVADAQISYKMLRDKNLEFKFNIKNIFNQVKEYYNNENSFKGLNPNYDYGSGQSGRESRALIPGSTTKYDAGIDDILFRAYNGRTFGLSVNYTF